MIETTPQIEELIYKILSFAEKADIEKITSFSLWNRDEMEMSIRTAILNKALIYVTDEEGSIIGVCAGVPDTKKKLFYVSQILTTKPGLLPLFMTKFVELWPDYSLAGHRYSNYKTYDTKRFIKHVLCKEARN